MIDETKLGRDYGRVMLFLRDRTCPMPSGDWLTSPRCGKRVRFLTKAGPMCAEHTTAWYKAVESPNSVFNLLRSYRLRGRLE